MALGVIGTAMAGALTGLGQGGQILGQYAERSALQREQFDLMAERDARLSELRKGEAAYAEDLRRKPGMEAQAEIDKAKDEFVDDPSGTVRKRTRPEMAEVEEGALRKRGLVQEALAARQSEQQRVRDAKADVARNRDDDRADRLADITAANFDITKKGAELDREIKHLTLDNAKRVDNLRKEFESATPQRKEAIRAELEILTGRDNDKFLPVPIKDETGAITGYRIFDTRGGRWVDDRGGSAEPTQAHIDALKARHSDPAAIAAFEAQFGKGSASRHLPKKEAPKPKPSAVATTPPGPRGLAEVLESQRPRPRREFVDLTEDDRMPIP